MAHVQRKASAWLLAVAIGSAAHAVVVGKVEVRVEHDKSFDFRPMRTWTWNPTGPGEVKMARTPNDDPEAIRRQAEPIIVDAVSAELADRGLKAAADADLHVTYYLLLTTGMSAQTLGQFLPATPQWGLPPFAPATQSLKVMNQGSLVLDLSAKREIVWRGVADAQVKMDADAGKREDVLRKAVHELLRRYPPR